MENSSSVSQLPGPRNTEARLDLKGAVSGLQETSQWEQGGVNDSTVPVKGLQFLASQEFREDQIN